MKTIAPIALLALLLLVFGCTQPQTEIVRMGEAFTVKEGFAYNVEGNDLTIRVVSFNDSRCPEGVQCVWAGELGVTLTVSSGTNAPDTIGYKESQIILGETTNPSVIVFNRYSFELISIDFEAKEAQIKVTEWNQREPNEKEWFSIEPIQCQGNLWDEWDAKELNKRKWEGEEELITVWLEIVNGVRVYDYASKQVYEIVCLACSCPRGDRIAVLVNSSNSAKMLELGWEKMDSIACTEEAKLCPDGSAVGREAPFCDFAPCPGGIEPEQPPEEKFFIKKTDVPGFVIEPETINTKIFEDGRVTIETIQGYSESPEAPVSLETFYIGTESVAELKQVINGTNFFELTEEDARQCVADAPTVTLEINLEENSNSVYGIGSECEQEKLVAAYEILSAIDELQFLTE